MFTDHKPLLGLFAEYKPIPAMTAARIQRWALGPVCRVFANNPGDLGSIPGRVIPKTLKNGTWYLLA